MTTPDENGMKTVSFSIYPHPDGPFAEFDTDTPNEVPNRIERRTHDRVWEAAEAGLAVPDGGIEEAGEASWLDGTEYGYVKLHDHVIGG